MTRATDLDDSLDRRTAEVVDMIKDALDATAIRYAVGTARRLGMSEQEICSMVHAVTGLHVSCDEPSILGSLGERYDGTGFPRGLARNQIPIGARILAVVRIFEVLRLWGRDQEQVLTHIRRRAGTDLDPAIVDEFLTLIRHEDVLRLRRRRGAKRGMDAA